MQKGEYSTHMCIRSAEISPVLFWFVHYDFISIIVGWLSCFWIGRFGLFHTHLIASFVVKGILTNGDFGLFFYLTSSYFRNDTNIPIILVCTVAILAQGTIYGWCDSQALLFMFESEDRQPPLECRKSPKSQNFLLAKARRSDKSVLICLIS